MGRSGWTEHPERDRHPDPSSTQWTGADMQTSTEFVQTRLVLSEHTVNRHVANILRKLGLPSRAAAASLAGQHGLA